MMSRERYGRRDSNSRLSLWNDGLRLRYIFQKKYFFERHLKYSSDLQRQEGRWYEAPIFDEINSRPCHSDTLSKFFLRKIFSSPVNLEIIP
jgi:hypothetical protein